MSAVINSTRDGIAGYWDGDPDYANSFPKLGKNDCDISYLRPANRAYIFDQILVPTLKVEKNGNKVTVTPVPGTTAITELTEPAENTIKKQLKHLRTYADLRVDRVGEIAAQANDITSFFGAIAYLDNDRHEATMEVVYAALRLVIVTEMRVKHLARTARPIDLSSQVQPVIQTPDHSSFPSGHATEAYAIATVLYRLMTGNGPLQGITDNVQVFRLAHRIAANRVVAGVHYPMDNAAGALLGISIGEHIWRMAAGISSRDSLSFDPNTAGDSDFTHNELLSYVAHLTDPAEGTMPDDEFATYFDRARKEWR